jgi:multidrug efflux pump subunit AcrB
MSPIVVALRRPITIIMLFMIPISLGIISFPKLPVERFPRTNFPFVSVNISYPGAAPGDVETQITERIEKLERGQLAGQPAVLRGYGPDPRPH